MHPSRRDFLAGAGVGLLGFWVGGCERRMSPADARRQGAEFRVLNAAEVTALEALGDELVPGAASAGLAHFIDHQLAAPREQTMLMIQYLGVPPPYAPFYKAGLAALDAAAGEDEGFASLDPDARRELVGRLAGDDLSDWSGPPAPFFYFVTRNDAVDVVYGTRAGFEQLGVPYMAHIDPPSRWGE